MVFWKSSWIQHQRSLLSRETDTKWCQQEARILMCPRDCGKLVQLRGLMGIYTSCSWVVSIFLGTERGNVFPQHTCVYYLDVTNCLCGECFQEKTRKVVKFLNWHTSSSSPPPRFINRKKANQTELILQLFAVTHTHTKQWDLSSKN